jgi:hypothetical protein
MEPCHLKIAESRPLRWDTPPNGYQEGGADVQRFARTKLCLQAIILAINSGELWPTVANGLDGESKKDQFRATDADSLDTQGRT